MIKDKAIQDSGTERHFVGSHASMASRGRADLTLMIRGPTLSVFKHHDSTGATCTTVTLSHVARGRNPRFRR